MIVRAKDGQSLIDVALMATGSAEGVWALALRNGMSVTDAPGYGAEIAYEGEDIADARTASRYEAESVCPATEVTKRELAWLLNKRVEVIKPDFEGIVADRVKAQSTRASVFDVGFTATFS
jgi:hypothetical protein